MLSEKAKGKQRAIEPVSEASTSSDAQASIPQEQITRDFVIRFTEGGIVDLLVTVHKGDVVRDVKKKVKLIILLMRHIVLLTLLCSLDSSSPFSAKESSFATYTLWPIAD